MPYPCYLLKAEMRKMKRKLGWKNLLAPLNLVPICKIPYISNQKSFACLHLKTEKYRKFSCLLKNQNYLSIYVEQKQGWQIPNLMERNILHLLFST